MVQESRCWRDEAASRDWADARPDRALCLVHVLVVVGNLSVASVLAGNKDVVDDAIHDVAALGSGAVTFWELVAARRANGIPFRTLKRIIQIFIYFVDLIASVMYNNKKEVY
jgi:ATP-dependent protease HslVU (ClpYQ) peptidase subunit